jgi:uncharacterized membrane protein YkgB
MAEFQVSLPLKSLGDLCVNEMVPRACIAALGITIIVIGYLQLCGLQAPNVSITGLQTLSSLFVGLYFLFRNKSLIF